MIEESASRIESARSADSICLHVTLKVATLAQFAAFQHFCDPVSGARAPLRVCNGRHCGGSCRGVQQSQAVYQRGAGFDVFGPASPHQRASKLVADKGETKHANSRQLHQGGQPLIANILLLSVRSGSRKHCPYLVCIMNYPCLIQSMVPCLVDY